jgi:hypothetical protein
VPVRRANIPLDNPPLTDEPHSKESDFTFPLEFRRRAEDLLVEVKATYHIQVFSGVEHGFATRGDPNVEHSRQFIPLSFGHND